MMKFLLHHLHARLLYALGGERLRRAAYIDGMNAARCMIENWRVGLLLDDLPVGEALRHAVDTLDETMVGLIKEWEA